MTRRKSKRREKRDKKTRSRERQVYQVTFRPSGRGDFEDLPPDVQPQIASAIRGLAQEPRPLGVKYLGKSPEGGSILRHRSGNYRVVYEVSDDAMRVCILMIDDRRDIYERLDRLR